MIALEHDGRAAGALRWRGACSGLSEKHAVARRVSTLGASRAVEGGVWGVWFARFVRILVYGDCVAFPVSGGVMWLVYSVLLPTLVKISRLQTR